MLAAEVDGQVDVRRAERQEVRAEHRDVVLRGGPGQVSAGLGLDHIRPDTVSPVPPTGGRRVG